MTKTLKSMTAYGRASTDFEEGRFDLEIIGTNRRHLEINLSLPRELLRFEPLIKKWVADRVSRGQVSINLYWKKAEERAIKITADIALAKAIFKAAEDLALALKIPNVLSLKDLLQERDVLVYEKKVENDTIFEASLKKVVDEGFDNFDQMKQKEGENLLNDFVKRLNQLKENIEKIEKLSPNAVNEYRTKLQEKLKEYFENVENDERVLKEIALFADRIDITEEIVRFKSHLKQFETTLKQEGPKGKRIEFLLQEFTREINTIGSKTALNEVSSLVVDSKCEIERIREQSQNIE